MSRLAVVSLLFTMSAGLAPAAEGEKGMDSPWEDTAEFSLVVTKGNSETTNLAFKNGFKRSWGDSQLLIDVAALRAEVSGMSSPRPTARSSAANSGSTSRTR